MRCRAFALLIAAGLTVGLCSSAWASEEALLKKLVEKGILTSKEADEVRAEVAAEEASSAQLPTAAPAPAPAASPAAVTKEEVLKALPEWVKTWKWSGDLRLRHETQRREPAVDRNRERFRLRFGFVTKPWDPVEIGVRLTSGASGNPGAPNQSFTDTFDKKPVFIDRAYVKYSPCDFAALTGGKMANPFYSTENVWDPDVTPEGAALQLAGPAGWTAAPFANFGVFQIAELNGDAGDPALFGVQGGLDVKLPFLGSSWKSSIGY